MDIIDRLGWSFDYKNDGKHIFDIQDELFKSNYFVRSSENDVNNYDNYRKSADLHRLIRNEIRKNIKSDVKYSVIVNIADNMIKSDGRAEYAFPLGISVNNIMMHDTVLDENDNRKFSKGDVVKIDLGIHIDGDIIDSAFTHIVDEEIDNHKYKPLLDASLDSVYTAIAYSGPDSRIKEISKEIEEVIQSYELEDGTKINAVFGFGGHNIEKYKVHGDKLVLCKPHKSQNDKVMVEGEIFAIETYASTGSGKTSLLPLDKCSHYSKNYDFFKIMKKHPKKNIVYDWCENTRHGMPFNKTWIDNKIGNINHNLLLAVKEGSIIAYPPVVDVNNKAMVSQFEHTIRIKEGGVEIFSFGDDY